MSSFLKKSLRKTPKSNSLIVTNEILDSIQKKISSNLRHRLNADRLLSNIKAGKSIVIKGIRKNPKTFLTLTAVSGGSVYYVHEMMKQLTGCYVNDTDGTPILVKQMDSCHESDCEKDKHQYCYEPTVEEVLDFKIDTIKTEVKTKIISIVKVCVTILLVVLILKVFVNYLSSSVSK
jgi:hypothetical protein